MKKFLLFIFALASGSMSLLAQPVITSQPTNQFVVSGGNATFSVMVTGVGPFTYQWQLNGTNLPTTNIITTVAGNGSLGFSGDGGSATNAQLNSPGSIVVDQFEIFLLLTRATDGFAKWIPMASSPRLQALAQVVLQATAERQRTPP